MISDERLKELADDNIICKVSWDERVGMARELLALRNVREGWQLVPVEPSWEMLSADGCKEHHNGQPCLHHDNRKRIWSAMLTAASEVAE